MSISDLLFSNVSATTAIYTLSLHDALPIFAQDVAAAQGNTLAQNARLFALLDMAMNDALENSFESKYDYALWRPIRSEEHTSELQSLRQLVCLLLLEKKKIKMIT